MSLSIGLDISKEKIDCYCQPTHIELLNNKQSIKQHFKDIAKDSRIVMEATGKYHRLAHRTLEEMGFQVMLVNPYQSKHFAHAMNLLCKTDKVDAKMLSQFAQRMQFKQTLCASQKREDMQDLSRHLDDLKKMKVETGLRLRDSEGFIAKSLRKTLKTIDKEIEATQAQLKSIAIADESLQQKLTLLLSIPGIGEPTAISLLSYLRELGHVNKREIAALSGLAPMNNESGCFKGKRRVKGGRHDVRTHLFMPILGAATQHNQRLKSFYTRLVESGKPKKVALTACMRKLIVWANAILATGQPWCENNPKMG